MIANWTDDEEEVVRDGPDAWVVQVLFPALLEAADLHRLATAVRELRPYPGQLWQDLSALRTLPVLVERMQEVRFDRDPRFLLGGWSLQKLRASAAEVRWTDAWRAVIPHTMQQLAEGVGRATGVLRLMQHPPQVTEPVAWALVRRVHSLRHALARRRDASRDSIWEVATMVGGGAKVGLRRQFGRKRLPRGWSLKEQVDLARELAEAQERCTRNRRSDHEWLRHQGVNRLREWWHEDAKNRDERRRASRTNSTPHTSPRVQMEAARVNARARLITRTNEHISRLPGRTSASQLASRVRGVEIDPKLDTLILMRTHPTAEQWMLRLPPRCLPSLSRAGRIGAFRTYIPIIVREVPGGSEILRRVVAAWIRCGGLVPELEWGALDIRFGFVVEVHVGGKAESEVVPFRVGRGKPVDVVMSQTLSWPPAGVQLHLGVLAEKADRNPTPLTPEGARIHAVDVARIRASTEARTRLASESGLPATRIEKIQRATTWAEALQIAWRD